MHAWLPLKSSTCLLAAELLYTYLFALFFTGISVDPAGSKGVTIGVCNSPTLEANPDENTAMTFKFRFEEGGSHRIVVLLLCMSEGGDVMPMRKDFRHYAVNNMAPRDPKSGTKCLNIHRYLKGSNFKCTHFQVQFIGAAFGSYLSIDSVYFYKACRKYYIP